VKGAFSDSLLAISEGVFDLYKTHIFQNILTGYKHLQREDVSRKYRIKQNNDYPANKPSFHAVFQDAAQPLYKRFSIRVTSQFVFDQAL